MAAESVTAEDRACLDPDCSGRAEPEQDGDLVFWQCAECGYQFGWVRLKTQADACALGVPEDQRIEFAEQAGTPVTIGRKH